MRCGGRLHNSLLDSNAKHPIFLPREAEITYFVISDTHRKAHHAGLNLILAKLRQKYWFSQARRTIKTAIYSNPVTRCLTCLKDKATPYAYPEPPPLPSLRVRPTRPFTSVGIDYFGPIRCRLNNTEQKSYGIILTCMSCRAIHIEITIDLSTLEFIRAFRRFIARRGVPKFIFSDNGSQLVAARQIAE